MKVYNEEKTEEITEYDLSIGYLENDILIIHHDEIKEVNEIDEIGHYEVTAEYPNGGKDIEWIVDSPKIEGVEGRPAYDEEIPIMVYKLYSEKELNKKALQQQLDDKYDILSIAKERLKETDFKTLKYIEGYYTDEEYAPIKIERESLREEVRAAQVEVDIIQSQMDTLEMEDMEDV